jgi:hypothetical protein
MAGTTGLEPATSAVTGQRSNQLSYVPTSLFRHLDICHIESSVSRFSLFSLGSIFSLLWTQFRGSIDTKQTPKLTTATTRLTLPDESVFLVSKAPFSPEEKSSPESRFRSLPRPKALPSDIHSGCSQALASCGLQPFPAGRSKPESCST